MAENKIKVHLILSTMSVFAALFVYFYFSDHYYQYGYLSIYLLMAAFLYFGVVVL